MKRASDLILALNREKATHKLKYYTPYPRQMEFHNALALVKGPAMPSDESGLLATITGMFGGNQVGKCATVSTSIDTPDGKVKLKGLWGRSVEVLATEDRAAKRVTAWIRKPAEECFRITMSDGQWVECPRGHLVLTQFGYVSVADVLKSLHGTFGHEWGSLRGVRASVLHLMGTLRGYWHRYLTDPRLCGGQLLSDEEGVQVFSPSRADAQKRNPFWSYLDGLANRYIYTPLQSSSHLSSQCGGLLTSALSVFSSIHYGPSLAQRSILSSPEFQPSCMFACHPQQMTSTVPDSRPFLDYLYDELSQIESRNLLPSSAFSQSLELFQRVLGPGGPLLESSLSWLFPNIDGNHIVSINTVGVHTLYDMEVEDVHCYNAGGLIHHNSLCGGMHTAIHLTGLYPDWWEGHRFDKPVDWLVGSNTNETNRDICQSELFGDPTDDAAIGTGAVPIEDIGKTVRKAGVPNAYDTVLVRHHDKSGVPNGWSKCSFRAYEQGAKKHMGIRKHGIWGDEEPPQDIMSQYVRATLSTKGIIYLTMTPEEGVTEVVDSLMNNPMKGTAFITMTWDDALHMTKEIQEIKLSQIPLHEREMRSQGIPFMGKGLVFPVSDDEIACEPFPIPDYYPRICGIDFGWDHPFAAAWVAWDRDTDTVYVYDVYCQTKALPPVHASAIKSRGEWIPVMWPHDGLNTEKGSGEQLAEQYRNEKLNMHYQKFSNPPVVGQLEGAGGNKVEPGLLEMLTRMETGRLKVFSNLKPWFDEKRMYHRDNNKVVALKDDIMSATRYAMLMLRHATTRPVIQKKTAAKRGNRNW